MDYISNPSHKAILVCNPQIIWTKSQCCKIPITKIGYFPFFVISVAAVIGV